MSRGPGKVQRGVLDALGRWGKLSTPELTGAVFPMWGNSHLSSVRRALRALHRAGRVHCLGADLSGSNTWCLSEHRGLYVPRWAERETRTLGEVMGEGWLTRALNSAR